MFVTGLDHGNPLISHVAYQQVLTPDEFAACSTVVRPLLRGFTCRAVPGGLLLREALQPAVGAGSRGSDRAAAVAAGMQPVSAGLIPRGSSFELLIATSTGNTAAGEAGRGAATARAPDVNMAVSKELARLFWAAPASGNKEAQLADVSSSSESDEDSSSSSSSSDEDSESSKEGEAISDSAMVDDAEGGANSSGGPPGCPEASCHWGPVPLAVRSSLANLLHMALLVQTSATVDEGGGKGGGGADALESLAAHRGLPSLPEGESSVTGWAQMNACQELTYRYHSPISYDK